MAAWPRAICSTGGGKLSACLAPDARFCEPVHDLAQRLNIEL
jgi:hypothetical protein